ncbi:uncharacterized protein SOCEGT47_017620 [Sorangium cellulosum]|uniref:Uncharacterized protein n=1 Tax=Sorangium cellulosum TaxID=56 RepID=A0A4P2PXD4_SORCE|nr:hypothetical protein [Sorangium cellulosum]AUX21281.1 uncharacterized protein SOCEGT47_017620 [Sorangium cellulosum]
MGSPEDAESAIKAMQEAMKASGAATPAEPGAMPIDWSTEATPAAANGVQVLHSPRQFAVVFTEHAPFPGRNAPDGRAGAERARVVSSLRLDPEMYFQALCVMASNWNRFVEAHIPPQMRQPRFKLLDAGDGQLYGIKRPKEEDDGA